MRGKVRDMRGEGQKTEKSVSGVFVCVSEWQQRKRRVGKNWGDKKGARMEGLG